MARRLHLRIVALCLVPIVPMLPQALEAQGRPRQVRTEAYEGKDLFPSAAIAPAEAGIDRERLEHAARLAKAGSSDGLLVLHRGRMVLERYWNGKSADDVQQTYSATKGAIALLIGRLLGDGSLDSLDQSLADFVPELRARGLEQLTFRNVMAMQSGLEQSAALDQRDSGSRLTQLEKVLQRRIVHPPFTRYQYNNAAYRAIFYALEAATGRSIPELSNEELFAPLGMSGAHWMVWRREESSTGYQSIRMRPRDLAKLGLILLAAGDWQGEPFVSTAYVRELLTPPNPEENPSYGLFWHLNGGSFYRGYTDSERIEGALLPGTPADAFAGYGARGQILVAVPSLELLWVRTGPEIPSTLWERPSFMAELSRAIVAAIGE